MEDSLPFQWNGNYNLHLSVENSQPENDRQEWVAYGHQLKAIADLLWGEDLFTLTKDSMNLKIIISGLKDVVNVLEDLEPDPEKVLEIVVDELYGILKDLHQAGDRANEADFAIRKVKYEEFLECHKRLKEVAKKLSQS